MDLAMEEASERCVRRGSKSCSLHEVSFSATGKGSGVVSMKTCGTVHASMTLGRWFLHS